MRLENGSQAIGEIVQDPQDEIYLDSTARRQRWTAVSFERNFGRVLALVVQPGHYEVKNLVAVVNAQDVDQIGAVAGVAACDQGYDAQSNFLVRRWIGLMLAM